VTSTVVSIDHGLLRGSFAGGVHSFKGVPYAEPPFGAGRLRPPRAVAPWSGVRDAIAFGAEPPQLRPPGDHPAAAMVWDPAEPGEDCLNLNIWTPDPIAGGLPVMVWIPGGMFEVGSGASYDGSRFARDGVVCVTINYRVATEGFLYLADGGANLGLLDQIAALEWVHDNIAAFGGDRENVTIFGESAGAMSVGTLLAVPRAQGLFRRAICQSGAADRVVPAETALRMGRELADRLGVDATREGIETIPPERLLLAEDLLTELGPQHGDRSALARIAGREEPSLPDVELPDGGDVRGYTVDVHAASVVAVLKPISAAACGGFAGSAWTLTSSSASMRPPRTSHATSLARGSAPRAHASSPRASPRASSPSQPGCPGSSSSARCGSSAMCTRSPRASISREKPGGSAA